MVRYCQLASRTIMTLRGSRWNNGLTDRVNEEMVVVHAFGSFRPMVWNPIISVVSMSAAIIAKTMRDVSPFGVVHLMRCRVGVSVVVNWFCSPGVFDVCC